jgi:hypothetical protein
MAHPETFNYRVGLGNVGSYQVSGLPFVSGGIDCLLTAEKVPFDNVTQWFVVSNVGQGETQEDTGGVKVAFSENGISGSNFLTVPSGSVSPRIHVKCTEIWVWGSSRVDVMAGLTSINRGAIDNTTLSPSGSNWSGSAGVLVG